MSRVWGSLAGNRPVAVLGLALLAASYPALLAAALFGLPWVFAVAAAVSYLAELHAYRTAPFVVQALSRAHLGVTLRFLYREALVLVLLARVGDVGTYPLAAFGFGLMALQAVRAAHSLLVLYVTRRRRLPVVTRAVDLSRLHIPDAPPGLLVRGHVRKTLHLDLAPMAGLVATAVTGVDAAGYAGIAVSLALGAAAAAAMLRHALLARPLGDKQRILAEVNAQVRAYRPEVVLYFSGSTSSIYQVNMWLPTLTRLDRPAVVVLRERELVPLLDPTSAPVVAIPGGVDLMNFEMPDVRVALYPANAGKNIHLLRLPGIKHVFIGHGDSDKQASFNPFSKVYDEVWVAGRAGRDRYLRAQVGVRDESIVEVGRPQLTPIRTQGDGLADRMFTVLYAPTWEGWTEDLYHTSLVLMGARIVRGLLEHDPPVRMIYKPHPLTGTCDRAARRAHERIVAMIERANAERGASGFSRREAEESARARAEARASLPELERRLDEVRGPTENDRADEAQRSRDSGTSAAGAEAQARRHSDAWDAAYWASAPAWAHRVVTGPLPTLYACFNHADLLVSDVSSVVADFIQSQKPYVVTDPASLGDAAFREEYPTASAAYLLGVECGELAGILEEVVRPGRDRMARRRRALKTYLLGPDAPDAMTRFNDAVDLLVRKSSARPPPPRELEPVFDSEPEAERPAGHEAEEDLPDRPDTMVDDLCRRRSSSRSPRSSDTEAWAAGRWAATRRTPSGPTSPPSSTGCAGSRSTYGAARTTSSWSITIRRRRTGRSSSSRPPTRRPPRVWSGSPRCSRPCRRRPASTSTSRPSSRTRSTPPTGAPAHSSRACSPARWAGASSSRRRSTRHCCSTCASGYLPYPSASSRGSASPCAMRYRPPPTSTCRRCACTSTRSDPTGSSRVPCTDRSSTPWTSRTRPASRCSPGAPTPRPRSASRRPGWTPSA